MTAKEFFVFDSPAWHIWMSRVAKFFILAVVRDERYCLTCLFGGGFLLRYERKALSLRIPLKEILRKVIISGGMFLSMSRT
ncbi:hypothetical protein R1flu_022358 [Riccia fluitans]|uniref:Uncharacterized protein n=1 Tax=Riccia fluitans TaxID=41844 RepID=A0ABD1ZSW3_9MARC